jgi:hypothetical protein
VVGEEQIVELYGKIDMRIPEITLNSQFGSFITTFIKYNNWIKNVIEIGSGSGNGSTQCFIAGLYGRENVNLICIEPKKEWFDDLVENTKFFYFVKPVNISAISYENLLIKTYDDYWFSEFNNRDDSYEIKNKWYEQDLSFFKNIKLGEGTIENNKIYDCVFIDGCEFSGYSEYFLLKNRTQCFILDDIYSFKCNRVHKELLENNTWKIVAEGNERNGWSCFIKQ